MRRTVPDPETGEYSFEFVLGMLDRLHRPKDIAYGDAWRKRGEVLSIFCNLARKYDRLVVAVEETERSATEALADTIADLCIYSGKYLTWLAECAPSRFESCPPHLSAVQASARGGQDALWRVLTALPAWEEADQRQPPAAFEECLEELFRVFGTLESLLVSQSEGRAPSEEQKIELAWALTYLSAWLLVHLGRRNPLQLRELEQAIEGMEGR